MKLGDRVTTPHGEGVIADFEDYSRIGARRYGVKLDKSPFDFPIAFYFGNELMISGIKQDRWIMIEGLKSY